MREKLLREYNAVPVFLSDELVHKYYNGARCVAGCGVLVCVGEGVG